MSISVDPTIELPYAGPRTRSRSVAKGPAISALPLIALAAALALHALLPTRQTIEDSGTYRAILIILTAACCLLMLLGLRLAIIRRSLQYNAARFSAGIALLALWDTITFKLAWAPLPYFPGPDQVFTAIADDWQLLGISTLYSLRLLLSGYLVGSIIGFVTGVMIGWSTTARYWLMPLLKIVGPIPATSWIPLALVVFPTSFLASVFLIVLAVWFPVTMMTASGVSSVRLSHLEVARTLGAGRRYLICRVAIPSAVPSIFIGLFMGLGMSFVTLIVAEMLGVKAGLGWYVNWAQGWAEYAKVYAALIITAFFFSGMMTGLFVLRDYVLVWQKGVLKW